MESPRGAPEAPDGHRASSYWSKMSLMGKLCAVAAILFFLSTSFFVIKHDWADAIAQAIPLLVFGSLPVRQLLRR